MKKTKIKFETEEAFVAHVISRDYWRNFYTLNGGIRILTLSALFELRREDIQVPCGTLLHPEKKKNINPLNLNITELPWDNWDDSPAILNKKSSENLLFLVDANRSTKTLYATSSPYLEEEWGGVIDIQRYSLLPTNGFLQYKNNRAYIEKTILEMANLALDEVE